MINKLYIRGFLFLVFLGLGVINVQAQTAIGKKTTEGPDVLLDFKDGDNRGIILPWVTNESDVTTPVGGTLIFDSNDKKVKYYQAGTSANWVDLSIKEGAVDTSIQQATGEATTHDPAVIGNRTTSVSGVLVLESSNKAMVLPKMENPHLNILSPQAGTMAFDTISKMLCIFNGSEWSFWKVKN
ncbi:hypothetical protein [Myroides sp. DW712]|uniref:hypothetical protein n=1 Tax=Myroides sp. DW712 TaxID=3389800 RepID=UPI00397A37B5